jgi:hypothetical protein
MPCFKIIENQKPLVVSFPPKKTRQQAAFYLDLLNMFFYFKMYHF